MIYVKPNQRREMVHERIGRSKQRRATNNSTGSRTVFKIPSQTRQDDLCNHHKLVMTNSDKAQQRQARKVT